MSSNHIHTWEPIRDLPENWKTSLENANVLALVRTWRERMAELRTKDLYKTFVEKLKRQWAIETGVLEGIYTLSEGATLALIQGGLDSALITHGDTDGEPEDVILKIQDQHLAIQGLYQFVSGQRPMGTSYIKELHQVLTAHQDTYLARDTLGSLVQRQLIRGAWKLWPNNVEHPDGTRFEYCPPEQVSPEMERLITLHESHMATGVPPDIEAAWIHHRFTLIHPFTDGNGRVARCLATLILLKENWLPLVVTRRERTAYIDALRAADVGDLKPLVNLFGDLQTRAIREALSLSEDIVKDSTAIEEILESAKQKFNQRRLAHDKQIRKSISTADSLVVLAAKRLEEIAAEVQELFVDERAQYRAYEFHATSGSGKANYHYHQIIQCARELGYFANLRCYQAWAAMAIVMEQRAEVLFSFHGIGHETSGILGCSAMFYTKQKDEEGETVIGPVSPLADEPFVFTYLEDPTEVQRTFRKWLDRCVVSGMDRWQKEL